MSETMWLVVGVIIAVLGVGIGLWFKGRKSKGRENLPQPKK